jgi:acetyl esterase/lipase
VVEPSAGSGRRGHAATPASGPAPAATAAIAYGSQRDQVGDLWLPADQPPGVGWPVVVLVHGGFWRERYRRELMDPLADDLVGRGWAVWNLEYRRVGGAGGWPETLADVAAGVDHLRRLVTTVALDLAQVTVVGHSAGGHLALWLAGRSRLPVGAPGADPAVVPARVVGLAPVADLRAADAAGLSDGAVRELLGGGPDEQPGRWASTDPLVLVGHGVPALLVHGHLDEDVPPEQSERFAARATRAGDPVDLVVGPWQHLELIDPGAAAWSEVLAWLTRPLRGRPPRHGRR